jgi:HK97 family phage prohead protease
VYEYEDKLLRPGDPAYGAPSEGGTATLPAKAAPAGADVVDVRRRLISGYASVWNFPDTTRTRDVMMPNCFADQLGELAQTGESLPLLVNHQKMLKVGESIALDEDDHGLYCTFRLFPDTEAPNNSARLQAMAADVAAGRPTPLSIGFLTVAADWSEDRKHRIVRRAELREVSLLLGAPGAQPLATLGPRRPRSKTVADYESELRELREWTLERDFEEKLEAERRLESAKRRLAALDPYLGLKMEQADQRERVLDRLRRFDPSIDWAGQWPKPEPVVRKSQEQYDRESEALDRKLIAAVERCETKRVYDPGFRRRFDRRHPGGSIAARVARIDSFGGRSNLARPTDRPGASVQRGYLPRLWPSLIGRGGPSPGRLMGDLLPTPRVAPSRRHGQCPPPASAASRARSSSAGPRNPPVPLTSHRSWSVYSISPRAFRSR